MTLTVNSASTSIQIYLTVDQFLSRYDYRLVSELVSDANVAQTQVELETDLNLNACIFDACAIFESTMKQGGRYEPTDILNLLAFNNGISVGANMVLRIISDLTMQLLRQRRGMSEETSESYKNSMKMLENLRTGEANLGFYETDTIGGTIQIHQLQTQDFANERLLSDEFAYFFGSLPDRTY